MDDKFSWRCPTCGHHTTITQPNFVRGHSEIDCDANPAGKAIRLDSLLIVCPNVACGAQFFKVMPKFATWADHPQRSYKILKPSGPVGIGEFTFLPTTAQPLSPHVPKGVAEDYEEGYLIRDLSPKASATLARRALQGMIRDFWEIKDKKTLHAELLAIKEKCDSDLYDAMMAVKSVGNIGAHPEQDVNLIVDVDPGEPQALLDLIHLLDHDWYVARYERQQRIEKMKGLGAAKAAAKEGGAA
jgi:hypothetical protein